MRRKPWGVCLWPGLPRLWRQGAWTSLALAVAAALALNGALISTFVWTGWWAPSVRLAAWAAVGVLFGGGFVYNRHCQKRDFEPMPAVEEDLFPQAQSQYLQGNWVETESLLGQLLRTNPRDLEARLLRATLYRRLGRWDEGRQDLDRLALIDGAEAWAEERRRERMALDRALEALHVPQAAQAERPARDAA